MPWMVENVQLQAHPLRHLTLRKLAPSAAAPKFFRCLGGLWPGLLTIVRLDRRKSVSLARNSLNPLTVPFW